MGMTRLKAAVFLVTLGFSRGAWAQAAPPPGFYPPSVAPGTYPISARPVVLPYSAAGAPPPGYHLEENPRKGLIVAGALTFGVPYLISLTIGGASRHEADRWLLVPVVGPVGSLTYGTRNCDDDKDPLRCTGNILIVVGLAFDLAAQMAGAVLFTMGFAFPKKQWVNDYQIGRTLAPSFTWTVAPRFDRSGGVGLSLSGTIF
jgi:hypothetical protein